MQTLTEAIFSLSPPGGVFRAAVVQQLFPGLSRGARKLLVHRALKHREIETIIPGLYILAPRFRKSELHPFVVAAMLHNPSYISLESALFYRGLIPEAVFQVSSVTTLRSRRYNTALGVFSFFRVPSSAPLAGVRMEKLDDVSWAYIATPLRAIADRLYLTKGISWQRQGLSFLLESLRIEEEDLYALSFEDLPHIVSGIRSRRVQTFLQQLEKALKRD